MIFFKWCSFSLCQYFIKDSLKRVRFEAFKWAGYTKKSFMIRNLYFDFLAKHIDVGDLNLIVHIFHVLIHNTAQIYALLENLIYKSIQINIRSNSFDYIVWIWYVLDNNWGHKIGRNFYDNCFKWSYCSINII